MVEQRTFNPLIRVRFPVGAPLSFMTSQYLKAYQLQAEEAISKGLKPLSVGTFLAYNLKGNAKDWISRYHRSLINSLENAGWVPSESRNKGLAYSPII